MSECLQLRSVLRAAAAPGAADASDSGATAAAASQSAALLLWQVQQQAARLGEGSLSRGVEGALCCQLAELLAENAQLHERLLGAAPTSASQPPSRRPSAVSFDATPASLPPSRRPSAALSPWTSPAAVPPGARPLSHSEGDANEPVAEMMRRRGGRIGAGGTQTLDAHAQSPPRRAPPRAAPPHDSRRRARRGGPHTRGLPRRPGRGAPSPRAAAPSCASAAPPPAR